MRRGEICRPFGQKQTFETSHYCIGNIVGYRDWSPVQGSSHQRCWICSHIPHPLYRIANLGTVSTSRHAHLFRSREAKYKRKKKGEEAGEQISWLCGNPRQFEAKILGCGGAKYLEGERGCRNLASTYQFAPIRLNSTQFYNFSDPDR